MLLSSRRQSTTTVLLVNFSGCSPLAHLGCRALGNQLLRCTSVVGHSRISSFGASSFDGGSSLKVLLQGHLSPSSLDQLQKASHFWCFLTHASDRTASITRYRGTKSTGDLFDHQLAARHCASQHWSSQLWSSRGNIAERKIQKNMKKQVDKCWQARTPARFF